MPEAEPANRRDLAQSMGSGSRRAKLGLIFRFGLAGAANTAVGFLAIAVLDVGLHLPPALANAIGFALGIVLSFTLNRSFVFRSNLALHTSGPRFLLVVAIAFALNQAVLALAGRVLGATPGGHIAAQLAGMSIYTLVVFVLCRIWIFRTGEPVEKNSAK